LSRSSDYVAGFISLFTDHASAPHQSTVALQDPVLTFDEAHAASQAVVEILGAVRPDIHRDELIAGVPLEAAAAVGREIAIRVNGSTYVWLCSR